MAICHGNHGWVFVSWVTYVNSLNNSIEEALKNNPFKNEQYIIDLFEDGVADFNELEKYMNLKEKYQQYISLKITFYDLDKQKKKLRMKSIKL